MIRNNKDIVAILVAMFVLLVTQLPLERLVGRRAGINLVTYQDGRSPVVVHHE